MDELKFLTATQLAQALGICKSTVFAFVRRGLLPRGVLIGHCRRWSLSEVKTALQAMKEGEIA